MLAALAVLRTVFLVFIVVFTARAMPWSLELAQTQAENYERIARSVSELKLAAWYAVAWIAFDTVASWALALRARRQARAAKAAASAAAAAPPTAAPRP
jgi:hypothetical protein